MMKMYKIKAVFETYYLARNAEDAKRLILEDLLSIGIEESEILEITITRDDNSIDEILYCKLCCEKR